MIEINLEKRLAGSTGPLLLNCNLQLRKGQFVSLYGPSGAGKTSLLRMIAGLMLPDDGKLVVEGENWYNSEKRINLSPQKRRIGFVFQDYALFPNMTVEDNLRFALKKGQDGSIIEKLLDITELQNLANTRPHSLSGGQKQRVALARALVQKPSILLLDEPLSALDIAMRVQLQDFLKSVHEEFDLTTIMVTHDLSEIFKLSDLVVKLDNGTIHSIGSADEVFGNYRFSGKFQFVGEVVDIDRQRFILIVHVLINHQIVKVIAESKEHKELSIGDRVVVASKAFNPVIQKIG